MYRTFIRSLKHSVSSIRFDNLNKESYKALIEFNVNNELISKAYYDGYLAVGMIHGRRVGRSISKETKNFSPDTFADTFKQTLLEWLRSNAGLRITSVRQTLVDYLIKEIEKGIQQDLDIREIAKNMQKLVNSRSFYRWQALRIARTETTAAANFGAISAGNDSGIVMDKLWISATDNRVRRNEKGDRYDHLDLNGVKVGKDELFEDNGAFLRFPGDPNAPAGTVINCRCTVALVPKRNSEGRLVFV